MSIRAKFQVISVTNLEAGSEVKLVPVTGGSVENEEFFKYTPYGEINIGLLNKEAVKEFSPGAEVYIDITPV